MSIDEARFHIGRRVVYRSGTPEAEEGVITSVSDTRAFVGFAGDRYSKETDPADLELLAGLTP